MEKNAATKSKNKILRFLPKAAQVSFQSPPFSPARDKRPDKTSRKLKTHLSKGFSGPIMSMIPTEARGKSKNFEEPTSPKVSCMGKIKHKNRAISKKKHASLPKEFKPVDRPEPEMAAENEPYGPARIRRIFGAGKKRDDDRGRAPVPDRAPSLSQMRRFASGRETLASFDWTTAQIAPEEDDVIISFSVPIALEPRKEINLWRRRTMAQPKPLQLNMVRAQ